MESEIATRHSLSAMTPKATRAHVALGLWLRLGFVGAFGLAAGLLLLVDGELTPLAAPALTIGGGAILAIAVWRARIVLDHMHDAAVATSGAPSATRGTQADAVSRPASGQAPSRAPIDAVRRVAGIRPEVRLDGRHPASQANHA